MIWHQWERENRNIVFRYHFRQDSFKRGIIVVYPKDLQPAMTLTPLISPHNIQRDQGGKGTDSVRGVCPLSSRRDQLVAWKNGN
jgi:hypothetical protein